MQSFRTRNAAYTVIPAADVTSVVALAAPAHRGPVGDQLGETLAGLDQVYRELPVPQRVVAQTVYLADPADQGACARVIARHQAGPPPVTTFVCQPPADGAAVAIEATSLGGADILFEHVGDQLVIARYAGLTWGFGGGLAVPPAHAGVYDQVLQMLGHAKGLLDSAQIGYQHVMRTWFYLRDITGPAGPLERYMEFNRARTDFYQSIPFGGESDPASTQRSVYPASTGIGSAGANLTMRWIALASQRADVRFVPLENPLQTPAWHYPPVYSPKSPKFTRAMAVAIGDRMTIWISGTSSILNSETHHPANLDRQVTQTLDNIERLIARDNLARHGLTRAGATLADLACAHVYLKHPTDYARCRELCAARLGSVPVLYTVADICRANLLVEIEGIAHCRTGDHPRKS